MGQSEGGLLGKLMEYGRSDFYPFHMPGHKRREIKDSFAAGFPDPYAIDITEIAGFDNLHHAEGILKESMEQAAEIYGADKTYYLVNGSTCGILSAICGCTDCGGKILMARNCHKSAYHGLILNRLDVEYLYPQFLDEFGINGGIKPEDVKDALERNRIKSASREKKIQAVLIVSPTYEGIVSDIRAIANIVHEYGIPLIVDEAHGAHLPFAGEDSRFPKSALSLGADVVIQSLHKTLPCFTQTAVLHIKGKLADRERIEQYLGIFQSSSPSYIFMAAMERCIRYMDGNGRDEMVLYEKRMEQFFERLRNLKVLKILDRSVTMEPSVYDWDLSKIVIFVGNTEELNGEELGKILRRKYHIEVEMCAPEYVIAMTSLMDTEEGLLRLSDALSEIDEMLFEGSFGETCGQACGESLGETCGQACGESFGEICGQAYSESLGETCGQACRQISGGMEKMAKLCLSGLPRAAQAVSMASAMEKCGRKVKLSESAGRVSKEFIYLYPPGIPIIAPGEKITEEILARVLWYKKAGFSVQGLSDSSLSDIITVAEKS